MSEYKLSQEIISRSVSDIWDKAKLEWALEEIYEADEPETCLCGHYPIIEVCTLFNRHNGKRADVGNCCVKKFIGLPSDKIFQGIKRVRKDQDKALNAETVDYAARKGWLNEWETEFCYQTMRKRKLSEKQATKRRQINAKVMARMKKQNQ